MKILVVAERKGAELRRVSLEAAARAKDLGAATVVEITGERYSPLAFTSALAKRVEADKADLVILGATLNGRDLGARLAARLGRAYAADVTSLETSGDHLEVTRPMYAGKVRARLRVPLPAVVTIRPGAVPLKATAAPAVEEIPADAPRPPSASGTLIRSTPSGPSSAMTSRGIAPAFSAAGMRAPRPADHAATAAARSRSVSPTKQFTRRPSPSSPPR